MRFAILLMLVAASACAPPTAEQVMAIAVERAKTAATAQWPEKSPPKFLTVVPFMNSDGQVTACGTLVGDIQAMTFVATLDRDDAFIDFLGILPEEMRREKYEAGCGSAARARLDTALATDPAAVLEGIGG